MLYSNYNSRLLKLVISSVVSVKDVSFERINLFLD